MTAKIMVWGLLKIFIDCEVNSVAALLMFARTTETYCMDLETLVLYLYNLVVAMIIVVIEWKACECKRRCNGDALSAAAHLKGASRHIEDFRNIGMKREFAVAV